MSDLVIQVENLSKRYRLGQREQYPALGDVLTGVMTAPWRRLRAFGRRQLSGERRAAAGRELWALQEVSFTVRQGEIIGIIGRNGAGKSTLLKILSRITKPTNGLARLRGRVGSLLEVGTGFHPELTGRENIYLNGAVLGMRKAEIDRKFAEIVAFAEVEEFIDTPVKRYSSGMHMRLAFAVAAHLEPEILLIDEVLAVGDVHFQKKCLGKMGKAAREGRTVLFVSHNMAAISALCSHGIVLNGGRIVYSGETEQCIKTYVAQNSQDQGSLWVRPSHFPQGRLDVVQVKSTLVGKQPDLILEMEIMLASRARHKPAFLAVDILDHAGVAIMQALPELLGFIESTRSSHVVQVSIQLPPLIPGQYFATIWAGSHNTETLDEVKEVVMFEILESPTPGRSYPHVSAHGHIVPHSSFKIKSDE
jgi:lipopolysaccharide transport system ATP-binding protein